MRLRHLTSTLALAGALVAPAAAGADSLNLRGIDAAASACTGVAVAPGDTAGLTDPALPGREVLCRRIAVSEGARSEYTSIDCADPAARFRGQQPDAIAREEWEFSSNGWVTLAGETDDASSIQLVNWSWAERYPDVLIGCYSKRVGAASWNWSGLELLTASLPPVSAKAVVRHNLPATEADDQVRGTRGNDRVNGGAGNDLLLGETGNDALVGGPGDDALFDNQGRDTLNGGPGNDRFSAADRNRDKVRCGAGADTVVADPGDDVARDCERVHWVRP